MPTVSPKKQAKRKRVAEKDLIMAKNRGGGWALLSKTGAGVHSEVPTVLYTELRTPEAAECARGIMVTSFGEVGTAINNQRMPTCIFDKSGEILSMLREQGVQLDDLVSLACNLQRCAERDLDNEMPF